jgi:hypothetical protein
LTELALGWDLERMRSAFTAACVAESTSSTGVSDLQALDPTMASSVAESLAMDNHPLLDKRLVSKEGTVVLTPNQSTPQGFESLLNSAQQSPFIAASGDRRRISVTYLAAQNFEAPVRPDVPEWFHAEPVEESTDADEHAGHEGIGLVDGGI